MNTIPRHARLLITTAPFVLMIAGQAQSQTAPADAPVAATSAAQRAQTDAGIIDADAQPGEDIIVVGTAGGGTRRQDAAFAVTTLSNDAIERAAPNSTADLLRMFAERLNQHRQNVAQLDASVRSLTLQLERGPQRISEETIAKFGKLITEQLRGENPALRKAYVRLLLGTVRVDNDAIHIQGNKAALESAVVRGSDAAISMVPGFDRKWCRLQDSNL